MTTTVNPTSPGDVGADVAPLEHASRAYTWLFVPGDRPDRFEKAAACGADAVIIDLEDAVAPADKPAARRAALEYVASRPAYIRLNGTDTEFFAGDLEGFAHAGDGLRGVMLPKSERLEQFTALDARLPSGVVVIALVETPSGILAASELARAPRVAGSRSARPISCSIPRSRTNARVFWWRAPSSCWRRGPRVCRGRSTGSQPAWMTREP